MNAHPNTELSISVFMPKRISVNGALKRRELIERMKFLFFILGDREPDATKMNVLGRLNTLEKKVIVINCLHDFTLYKISATYFLFHSSLSVLILFSLTHPVVSAIPLLVPCILMAGNTVNPCV